MVYIFGIIGFVMGFAIGLGFINVMLRHYTKEQIKENKHFRWTYGLAVWFFAIFGAWLGVWIFNTQL